MVTGAGICQTTLLSETGHLLRERDDRSGPESASHNRKQMRAKDRKSSQTVTAEGDLLYRSGRVCSHLHGDHPGKVILKLKCVQLIYFPICHWLDKQIAPPQSTGMNDLASGLLSFTFIHYPKRLTIGEYIKRFILKRQKHTGSAHNTTFQALFK